jgi:hypothetical protein
LDRGQISGDDLRVEDVGLLDISGKQVEIGNN